jgi:hypothetical protein
LLSATPASTTLALRALAGFGAVYADTHAHGTCAHAEESLAAFIEDRDVFDIVHFHAEFFEGFLNCFLPCLRLCFNRLHMQYLLGAPSLVFSPRC